MRAVYRGFALLRALGLEDQSFILSGHSCGATLAFQAALQAPTCYGIPDVQSPANRDLMGDDWFPYGIARDRAAIDAVLRYHHEQGLTERRLTIEDVFVPEPLDT